MSGCIMCGTPASAQLVIVENDDEVILDVCMEHGVEMANIKMKGVS